MTRQEAFTLLGVYILGMVWMILNYTYDISLVLCPTKILFGIPCPGCGIWTIIDYFLIMKVTKEKNLEKFITVM